MKLIYWNFVLFALNKNWSFSCLQKRFNKAVFLLGFSANKVMDSCGNSKEIDKVFFPYSWIAV